MGKEFAGLMPASEAKAHRGILVKVDGKEYSIGFDDYERHSKDKNGKDEYAGNKQVDHFEWNAKVQELGDAKAAARAYLDWCHEQHPVFDKKGNLIGYATYEPKFSQFSKHENYYKLLEDFNSYDSITGASAVQDAVKMNLPSKDNKLTAKELDFVRGLCYNWLIKRIFV